MNVEKRGIIVGMAIGDGYIQVRTRKRRGVKGTTYTTSKTLTVVHGPQQRIYCEWKAKRLGWALGKQVNVTHRKNGPGLKYDAYGFGTDHNYFGQVKWWLYQRRKKTFTRQVLNMLTPEGVAIWYMDDGHARRNLNKNGFVSSVATAIATQCTEPEVELIIAWFLETHGIEFKKRRHKRTGLFDVECNTKESHKFASLVQRFIPECMLYKLSHVADLRSHERQTPIGLCEECGATLYDNRRKGLCVKCYHGQHKR